MPYREARSDLGLRFRRDINPDFPMTWPNIRRPDFNQSLVHLTRERVERPSSNEASVTRVVQPFDVLKEILTSGILRASSNYIKGTRPAVCMSEMPLSVIHHFADPPYETNEKKKYRFYGLAFSKQTIFKAGGRPVIYLPDAEAGWIPDDEKWRHVRYEIGSVDWTHEREWRLPGDLDLTKLAGCYALVWSYSEVRELEKVVTAAPVRGVLPMENLTMML
jgi:hypothetical protein